MDSDSEEPLFEKEVKDFGNGGHITLPKEYVGETVEVTVTDSNQGQPHRISPPITTDKIDSLLANSTRSDFKKVQRENDNFPRECQFQYKHDVRLTVDVDLAHEGSEHPYNERGTIVYFIWDVTEEELDEHAEWFDKETDELSAELIVGVDPSADDILDNPNTVYNDLYEYDVKWNGSSVYSVKFNNRPAKSGRFYYPYFSQYQSLADYRESTAYWLATAISEAPKEEYDQYLNALQLDETVWGEKDTPLDFDREAALQNMTLYHP